MMGITNINSLNIANKVSNNEQVNSQSGTSKALGQEDFLKILAAQMSQQDSANSMSNTNLMAPLSQLGTSEGIGGLQQSLAGISAGVFSNQALQASTMVGRNVHVFSSQAALTAENGLLGAVASDHKLYDLQVAINDSMGKAIKHINLGEQEPGVIDFKWDGTGNDGTSFPPGKYLMEASATISGNKTNLETLALTRVASVTIGKSDSNVWLNTGDLGAVPLYDVWQFS